MLSAVALFAAAASAALLYLASPNCRIVHKAARSQLRGASFVCAGASLAAAMTALGVGAGLCLTLGTWMLGAVALPYLALLWRPHAPTERD